MIAAMTTRRRRRAAVDSSDDDDDDAPSPPTYLPPGKSFSSSDPVNNVAVAESRVRKVIVRSIAGLGMVTGFVGIVWAGHLYLSALVALIQVRRSLFLLSACTYSGYVALPFALLRYFLSRDKGRIVPLLPLPLLQSSQLRYVLRLFLRLHGYEVVPHRRAVAIAPRARQMHCNSLVRRLTLSPFPRGSMHKKNRAPSMSCCLLGAGGALSL